MKLTDVTKFKNSSLFQNQDKYEDDNNVGNLKNSFTFEYHYL